MITIIQADGVAERRQIDAMRARAAEKNADIERADRKSTRLNSSHWS